MLFNYLIASFAKMGFVVSVLRLGRGNRADIAK